MIELEPPMPKNPVRWCRSFCPDCKAIDSKRMKRIKGSKGTGDVFIESRCEKCNRVHIGLPAEPVRREGRKAKPAERETRNRDAPGDSLTYYPDI